MLTALHLLNRYLGLSETFVWNMLTGMKKFRPLVLAAEYENVDTFPLPEGKILSCSPTKRRLADLTSRFRNSYAEVDYQNCMQSLHAQKFELIHAHYGYRALVSLGLAQSLKKPLITNFYGYDLSHKKYLKRAMHGYKKLFAQGAGFFVEGPVMRDKLVKLGCSWDKIFIQRIAIYPGQYTYNPRFWDGKRPIRFLFVGRFVDKKGLLTALSALEGLEKGNNGIDWDLTIIGDGPQRKKVEQMISSLHMKQRVHLCGYVNPLDLKSYYASHDILLQPSQTALDGDCEGGAPTVLLEAQASGMPIIASWHDDIPNVVLDGKNAFLSEERDIEGLRKNILKMVSCHGDWPAMSKIGHDFILANHDVSVEIPEMEKQYFSFLGKL
ncbi:MAG: glycosyltransferase [Fibrobacteria bacterium]|nr:glycosyltransferase [Fibrobacteria bacterium]